MIAAANIVLAKWIVRLLLVFATLGAYQISMVPEVPVACTARRQEAPAWVIEVTVFAVVARVDITATSVFPLAGAPLRVAARVVAVLVPVAAVVVCTLLGAL
jgi:hypothetical protein